MKTEVMFFKYKIEVLFKETWKRLDFFVVVFFFLNLKSLSCVSADFDPKEGILTAYMSNLSACDLS